MDEYEVVIGLEVHVELLTESKMFCGCSTEFGSAPNTNTCPVCTGMPGVLPVINEKAIELAIKTGIAFNSNISKNCRFARKNYFYPDLPKNYQISQYEQPIIKGGYIKIGGKKINLTRIHLEEDAGKLIHSEEGDFSYVDFNRSGIPLLEIVTEPDIRSPEEAELFLLKLKQTLEYLRISDCNMEEGSLRCDANISVRKKGEEQLGVKVEVKNMNSFKAVRRALSYEAKRQISILKKGEKLVQETRLWNEKQQKTEVMRTKEEAHDYRYFPEPEGKITATVGKEVLREIFKTEKSPDEIVKEKNLLQIDDAGFIEKLVKEVIEENPKAIDDYRKGKEKVIGFLVGQVMKKAKGKANPSVVKNTFEKILK